MTDQTSRPPRPIAKQIWKPDHDRFPNAQGCVDAAVSYLVAKPERIKERLRQALMAIVPIQESDLGDTELWEHISEIRAIGARLDELTETQASACATKIHLLQHLMDHARQ